MLTWFRLVSLYSVKLTMFSVVVFMKNPATSFYCHGENATSRKMHEKWLQHLACINVQTIGCFKFYFEEYMLNNYYSCRSIIDDTSKILFSNFQDMFVHTEFGVCIAA